MPECRVANRDPFCRGCGAEGIARVTQARRLAHVPLGWRPTTRWVRVRRFRCENCGTIRREDTTAAAEPRGKLARAAVRWVLEAVVCQHLPVTACRHKGPGREKKIFEAVIATLTAGIPEDLPGLISLGLTITRRSADVLALFDHPGTSNGPSEAINGRLEHLRCTTLGFRNLTH